MSFLVTRPNTEPEIASRRTEDVGRNQKYGMVVRHG